MFPFGLAPFQLAVKLFEGSGNGCVGAGRDPSGRQIAQKRNVFGGCGTVFSFCHVRAFQWFDGEGFGIAQIGLHGKTGLLLDIAQDLLTGIVQGSTLAGHHLIGRTSCIQRRIEALFHRSCENIGDQLFGFIGQCKISGSKNDRDPQFVETVGKLSEFPQRNAVDPEINGFAGLGVGQMGIGRTGFGVLADKGRHIAVVIEGGDNFGAALQGNSGIQQFIPERTAGTVTVHSDDFSGAGTEKTGGGSIDFFGQKTASRFVPPSFRNAPVGKIQNAVDTFKISNDQNSNFFTPCFDFFSV